MPQYSALSLHIHREDIVVSVIIAVVGVFGLISNGTAMLAVRCNPALRNSFGLLCFSHSIANMGILLVFVFWLTPTTLLQDEIVAELIGKMFGLVNIMLWNVCVYSHLAISLNRVIAIALPLQASTILTVKKTFYVVLLCWTLGFCHAVPYFWTESCFIVFSVSSWTWSFAETQCGNIISTFTDFYTSLAVFTTIFLLDTTTLICLRLRRTRMNPRNAGSIHSDSVQRRRQQTEIRLFVQTICQNALFFYELATFHFISPLFQNHWGAFFTTTFPWEVCHALDGFVVVLFHFRLSHFKKKTPSTKTATLGSRIVPGNAWTK